MLHALRFAHVSAVLWVSAHYDCMADCHLSAISLQVPESFLAWRGLAEYVSPHYYVRQDVFATRKALNLATYGTLKDAYLFDAEVPIGIHPHSAMCTLFRFYS